VLHVRRQVIRGAAVAGLLLGLLAGCGDDDSEPATSATDAPDSGSTEPDGSTTTEGTLPPPFQDGEYFGKIDDIDFETEGGPYADFDVARLHTGAEATQAQADGVPGCEEAIDYCIEDTEDANRLVAIADDVEVLDVDYESGSSDARPSDLETFDADTTPPGQWVEITVTDAEVTRIEEIYFP
jgi:hypothetical protein